MRVFAFACALRAAHATYNPPSTPPATPPPATPPMPPLVPVTCDTGSRTDTQTLGPNGKYCYHLNVDTTGGCEAYYSMNPNTYQVRFCYNPNYPAKIAGTMCVASDDVDCTPASPALPPVAPSDCVDVRGRTNTWSAANEVFCTSVAADGPDACETYYSMTANGNTRLCYTPMADPGPGDMCAQTERVICSPAAPPPGAHPPLGARENRPPGRTFHWNPSGAHA